nr:MAG: hypothetical protein [Microvirus sp.]
MINVLNSMTFDAKGVKGEVNTGLSMTVPDQAMTIQELYRRFANGEPLGAEREAYYDEDDLNNYDGLDPISIAEMKEENSERLRSLKALQVENVVSEESEAKRSDLANKDKMAEADEATEK